MSCYLLVCLFLVLLTLDGLLLQVLLLVFGSGSDETDRDQVRGEER